MEFVNTDAVIEVGVEDVKDDLIPGSFIVSGILYSAEKHVKDFITKYIDEVRRAQPVVPFIGTMDRWRSLRPLLTI